MSNTLWLDDLKRSLKGNRREASARYLQLATVAEDGSPRNRTIVFRAFAEESSALLAVTDARSDKVPELRLDARVELCWYFPVTREQFRIRALATLLESESDASDPTRVALWDALSDAASEQFFWAHPGEEKGVSEELSLATDAPEHFVGLRFSPTFIDHLQLKNPQRRSQYTLGADAQWHCVEVNP